MCFQRLKWKLVRKMYSKQGFTCTVSPSVYQQTSQITEKIDIQTWGDQTERPRCILDEAAVPNTSMLELWIFRYFRVFQSFPTFLNTFRITTTARLIFSVTNLKSANIFMHQHITEHRWYHHICQDRNTSSSKKYCRVSGLCSAQALCCSSAPLSPLSVLFQWSLSKNNTEEITMGVVEFINSNHVWINKNITLIHAV